MIRVIRKGKRPFNMCLATDCETKADWGKEKGKKGAKGKKAPAKIKEIVKKRSAEEKTARKS